MQIQNTMMVTHNTKIIEYASIKQHKTMYIKTKTKKKHDYLNKIPSSVTQGNMGMSVYGFLL